MNNFETQQGFDKKEDINKKINQLKEKEVGINKKVQNNEMKVEEADKEVFDIENNIKNLEKELKNIETIDKIDNIRKEIKYLEKEAKNKDTGSGYIDKSKPSYDQIITEKENEIRILERSLIKEKKHTDNNPAVEEENQQGENHKTSEENANKSSEEGNRKSSKESWRKEEPWRKRVEENEKIRSAWEEQEENTNTSSEKGKEGSFEMSPDRKRELIDAKNNLKEVVERNTYESLKKMSFGAIYPTSDFIDGYGCNVDRYVLETLKQESANPPDVAAWHVIEYLVRIKEDLEREENKTLDDKESKKEAPMTETITTTPVENKKPEEKPKGPLLITDENLRGKESNIIPKENNELEKQNKELKDAQEKKELDEAHDAYKAAMREYMVKDYNMDKNSSLFRKFFGFGKRAQLGEFGKEHQIAKENYDKTLKTYKDVLVKNFAKDKADAEIMSEWLNKSVYLDLQNMRADIKIENANWPDKLVGKYIKAVEGYRKLPLKKKLLIGGALFGVGMATGMASGALAMGGGVVLAGARVISIGASASGFKAMFEGISKKRTDSKASQEVAKDLSGLNEQSGEFNLDLFKEKLDKRAGVIDENLQKNKRNDKLRTWAAIGSGAAFSFIGRYLGQEAVENFRSSGDLKWSVNPEESVKKGDLKWPVNPEENLAASEKISELATIKKGEGAWHAVHRQLENMMENDPAEFSRQFGIPEEKFDNPEGVKKVLNGATMDLLIKNGIIDPDNHTELRISHPGTKVILEGNDIHVLSDDGYAEMYEHPFGEKEVLSEAKTTPSVESQPENPEIFPAENIPPGNEASGESSADIPRGGEDIPDIFIDKLESSNNTVEAAREMRMFMAGGALAGWMAIKDKNFSQTLKANKEVSLNIREKIKKIREFFRKKLGQEAGPRRGETLEKWTRRAAELYLEKRRQQK